MTADELDALAEVQVDVRRRYRIARLTIPTWEPAPVPPPPPSKAAAAGGGGGT